MHVDEIIELYRSLKKEKVVQKVLEFRTLNSKTQLNTIERTGYVELNTPTTFEGKKSERKRNHIIHAFTNVLIWKSRFIFLLSLLLFQF